MSTLQERAAKIISSNYKKSNSKIDINKLESNIEKSFKSGVLSEAEREKAHEQLNDLICKARVTKYFKREGTPGKYKYYYTEAEYKQAKGGGDSNKESSEKKEVEAVGHGKQAAIDYGVELVNSGATTKQIRERIEEDYPSQKENMSDILNVVLDYKDGHIDLKDTKLKSSDKTKDSKQKFKVGDTIKLQAPKDEQGITYGEAVDMTIVSKEGDKFKVQTRNKEGKKGEHVFDVQTINKLIEESKGGGKKESSEKKPEGSK